MGRFDNLYLEEAYEDNTLPADLGLETPVQTTATPVAKALDPVSPAQTPVGIQAALPGATQTAPAQTFEKRTRWVTDPSGYDQQSRLEQYELPTFGYTALSGQAPQALQGLQGWEFDQGGDGGIANWETMATGTNQLAVNYAIDPQTGERTGLDPGYGLKDASGLVHGVKFANQHRISQFFDPTTGKPVGKPVIQYIDPGENLGKILAIAPAFLNTLIPGVPLGSLITAAQTAGKVGSGEQVGLGEVANLVGVGSDVTGLKELKTAADAIKTAGQVQALEKAVKSGDVLGIASLGTNLLGKAGIDVPSDVKDTISTVNKYAGMANVASKAAQGDLGAAINLAMLGAKESGLIKSDATPTSQKVTKDGAIELTMDDGSILDIDKSGRLYAIEAEKGYDWQSFDPEAVLKTTEDTQATTAPEYKFETAGDRMAAYDDLFDLASITQTPETKGLQTVDVIGQAAPKEEPFDLISMLDKDLAGNDLQTVEVVGKKEPVPFDELDAILSHSTESTPVTKAEEPQRVEVIGKREPLPFDELDAILTKPTEPAPPPVLTEDGAQRVEVIGKREPLPFDEIDAILAKPKEPEQPVDAGKVEVIGKKEPAPAPAPAPATAPAPAPAPAPKTTSPAPKTAAQSNMDIFALLAMMGLMEDDDNQPQAQELFNAGSKLKDIYRQYFA